jgi:uroporphyrinogen-III decarboxylase
MNSRERVLAALNLQEPDRVPFCELGVDAGFAQKLLKKPVLEDVGISSLVQNPYTVEETKEIAEILALDNICYLLRAPTYAHMQVGVDGRLFTGDGKIKGENDLSMIEFPDPFDERLYEQAEEFVARKGDFAAVFATRIGLFQVVLSLGIADFSINLYTNLPFIEKLLDMYFDWMEVVAERMCKIGFDIFWTTDDFAFKTGLMFSLEIFRDVFAPRYRRVLEKVTIPWILHSDGRINDVLDLFIDLGISGVHPLEKGAMDIAEVKKRYGRKICLLGNVDLDLLGRGTPEETEKEVKELLKIAAPGGGYIMTSGNGLAAFLKPECVMAMSKAVHKFGKYPITV